LNDGNLLKHWRHKLHNKTKLNTDDYSWNELVRLELSGMNVKTNILANYLEISDNEKIGLTDCNVVKLISSTIDDDEYFILGTDGIIYIKKSNNIEAIHELNHVIQIEHNFFYSLALTKEGYVYSFLDDADNIVVTKLKELSDIISITIGTRHVLALNGTGYVYSFGHNNQGLLGLGQYRINILTPTLIPKLKNVKKISAGNCCSLALTNDGKVYCFGLGIYVPTLMKSLDNIINISCGYDTALVLTNDKILYGFRMVGIKSCPSNKFSGYKTLKSIHIPFEYEEILAIGFKWFLISNGGPNTIKVHELEDDKSLVLTYGN
jgi:hypothetical protein